MQSKNDTFSKLTTTQWVMLLPIIVLLGLSPIFIKYFPVQYPALPVDWKRNSENLFDLFTYSKHYLVLLSGAMALLGLFFTLSKDLFYKKSNRIFIYSLAGTLVIIILSTLFSKFSYAALWGGAEKYEGIFIWFSYLIIAAYVGMLAHTERLSTAILRTILYSGLVVTLIGLTQFFSHDIIRTEWFKALIMPPEAAKSATFAFEADRVYSTLYNPNFVAMYAATLIPISIFMCFKEKVWIYRTLWASFSVLLVINLIGSKNEGGVVGLAFSAMFALFLLLLKKVPLPKKPFIFSLGYCLALGIMLLGILGAYNNIAHLPAYAPKYALTHVETNGFDAVFDYNGKQLIARADPVNLNRIEFYTQETLLSVSQNEDGSYGIVNPDFSKIRFLTGLTENKLAFVHLMIDNSTWTFLLHPDGLQYINGYGVPTIFETTKGQGGFVGHEQAGSARGYIWSRTLPLILQSPLLGYGADNFIVAFPQKDYNMKYQVLDQPNVIIDKAHNLYLQLAMNFGISGLILILLLIGISLNGLFKQYLNTEGSNAYFYFAIILCILAYLGAGVFYDSSLHVSPLFWALVGFGYKDYLK